MTINKKHWYDGIFYDKVIAPNQDNAFKTAKELIKKFSSVLDVGCGTGRLSFQLADKCKKTDGIDLSEKNIRVAKKNLSLNPSDRISFYHTDAENFLKVNRNHYDYSVLSYVIHEIDEPNRVPLLKLLSDYSDKIILIDYLVPRPKGFANLINGIVEFVAGKEHYKNFKSYVFNDGIHGLAKQSGLTIKEEVMDSPKTVHIAVLSKN
jgi:SAM-dependent methyltransferase